MGWWRTRKLTAWRAAPFPERWRALLRAHVPRYARLDEPRRRKLEGDVAVFLADKRVTGCAGVVVDDVVRLTIAGEACVLLLGHEAADVFPIVREILVYPTAWRGRQVEAVGGGMRIEGDVVRLGEAWRDGQVILAWDSVKEGIADPGDGHDVVLHEFAHALDHADGVGDGAPVLPSHGRYRAWAEVLGADYDALRDQVADGAADVLRAYGATAPAEFFAVATETFFERPRRLRADHPALYAQLAAFYRQDPAVDDPLDRA